MAYLLIGNALQTHMGKTKREATDSSPPMDALRVLVVLEVRDRAEDEVAEVRHWPTSEDQVH